MLAHPLIAAYCVAVVPALAMAFGQPVWSRIDEAPNADFVIQLSHGVYPVADTTIIDAEIIRVLQAEGFFTYRYLSATGTIGGPPSDPTDIGPIPPGMSDEVNAVWMARHLWELSREADQTPLYYLSMAPVWWVADHLAGTYFAIYLLRLVNALLVATLAPIAMVMARLLAPAKPEIAWLAAAFAVILPGLDLNATRISNDAMAAAAGAWLLACAVRSIGTAWTWRRATWMGALLGIAVLVKLTAVGLVPALAVAALWPAPRSTRVGRLARLAVALAVALACLLPWLAFNLHTYGALLAGPRVARLLDAVPGSFNLPWVVLDFAVVTLTYWSGEPWGVLPLALPFAVLGALLTLTVAPVAFAWLRGRGETQSRGRMAVALIAVVGAAVTALTLLPAGFRLEVVGAGRYSYAAAPVLAALIAIGLTSILRQRLAVRGVVAAYVAVGAAMLAAGIVWAPPVLSPAVASAAPPPSALVVVATSSGRASDLTITVDAVALDRSGRTTWVAVTAVNHGLVEVDWPGVPLVTVGGAAFQVDYLRSTHFPGDLDPGQSVTGWLVIDLDPGGVASGQPLVLRFEDIDLGGYRALGEIDLSIAWPG